ncbi:hypothetical protein DFQ30_005776, partial [Apophysomyces sp. BC1015]
DARAGCRTRAQGVRCRRAARAGRGGLNRLACRDESTHRGAFMSWLDKLLPPKIKQTDPRSRKSIPEGLWVKCPNCEAALYRNDVQANLHVCPKCDHHMRIGARERLDGLLDPEGRYEIGQEIVPVDALKFKDSRKYPDRLKDAMDETGETDAMVVMGGAIHTLPVVVACFEFA